MKIILEISVLNVKIMTQKRIQEHLRGVLTLIVKFLGYELDRLPGKLIHQKIMGTYSVILKLGS